MRRFKSNTPVHKIDLLLKAGYYFIEYRFFSLLIDITNIVLLNIAKRNSILEPLHHVVCARKSGRNDSRRIAIPSRI